ncbi:MAG TPA: glycosyltransferase family 4 protein [Desulfomonilia bacterium]|nr:glycosyltransferase family 4 protein [Desulfomonilia bacterium]
MRIAHISLERGWRGGERQTLYLMEGLRARGHDCHLIARNNEAFTAHVSRKGFRVQIIRKPFVIRGGMLSRFDIVHVHETRGLQMAALWKPIHARPIVATRRVDNTPSGNPLTRLMYGQADRLVVISDKIRGVMIDWGMKDEKISVIPDAVDLGTKPSEQSVSKLRERFRSKKVIGCVASLEKRKDHHTLLKAASIVQEKRDDAVFVLIGDGDLRFDLEREASRLGLRNVVFEGYQVDPYSYYRVFDIFVMTSRQEGLGSSILDAFFYRVPVVVTAAGGMPEIVKDGLTGLLAEPGNPLMIAQAILRMLDDMALRGRCVENAHALLMERFTIEHMSESYELVYHDVLSHG